jgi:DNA (cytosine-5)-methyltransferase 1
MESSMTSAKAISRAAAKRHAALLNRAVDSAYEPGPERRLSSIELFTGAGGLAIGTRMAGFNHVALFERDAIACETLNRNITRSGISSIRDWFVRTSDVRDVDFNRYRGIDLVAGGAPCQPFSHGGKRQGRSDERDMLPEFIRAVRETRPRAFILENVRGLANRRFAKYFEYVRLQLERPALTRRRGEKWTAHHRRLLRLAQRRHRPHDYVVTWRTLNAADYGVPQVRNRVFIVGIRADQSVRWDFPRPTHSRETLLHHQYVSGTYRKRHNARRITRPGGSSDSKSIREKLPRLAPWRTIRDVVSELPAPAADAKRARIPQHVLRSGARLYVGHSGSPCDWPAKTLKAGRHGVPGGENIVVWPNGRFRYMTIREAARIQSFPNSWTFAGGWVDVIRQIGNAAPPGLVAAVARSVAKALRAATRSNIGPPVSATSKIAA